MKYTQKAIRQLVREVIEEGVYDPGILKAVFLAGGPGSGKSFIANQLFGVFADSFSFEGLKTVNSDKYFEFLLKKRGISTDLAKLTKQQFLQVTTGANSERELAKLKRDKAYEYWLAGRLGLIIDGTADDPQKLFKHVEGLRDLGYDVSMVFVNTSLDKAIERNNNRDRKLPVKLVTDIWNQVQKSIQVYKNFFGDNFVEILNDKDSAPGQPADIHPEIERKVRTLVTKPVQNPIGKQWINRELGAKASAGELGNNVTEALDSQYEIFCDMDGVLCDFVKQWTDLVGEHPDTYRRATSKEEFDVILDSTPVEFWSQMEWMPGSKPMWNIIKKYGAKILSAPADSEDSKVGKLAWVKNNIPGTEVIFKKSYLKQEKSGPNKILIDDLKRNIDQWREKGGIGILYQNPQQVIKDLSDLGIK